MDTASTSATALADQHEAEAGGEIDSFFDENFGHLKDEPAQPEKKAATPPKVKPASPPAKPSAAEPQDEGAQEEAPEQQDEEETPEEVDPDTTEDDEEDAADLEGVRDKDKVQAMLDKRRAKLEAARKERDAAVAELEQMKANFSVAPVLLQPTAESPLSAVKDMAELDKAAAAWEKEMEWCMENPEGGVRGEVEWTPEKVKLRMKQAATVLRKEVPARAEYLREFQTDVQRLNSYDFIAAPGPLREQFQQFGDEVLSRAPGIASHPNHLTTLADAFIGAQVRSGKWAPVVVSGKVKLVPVSKTGDGTGKPRAATVATEKPLLRKPAPPPARRTNKAEQREQAIASAATPEEAARLEIDALFDD